MSIISRIFSRTKPTPPPSPSFSLHLRSGQICITTGKTREYFTVAQLVWLSRSGYVPEAKRRIYIDALHWAEDNA